jgi:hypothetical protein
MRMAVDHVAVILLVVEAAPVCFPVDDGQRKTEVQQLLPMAHSHLVVPHNEDARLMLSRKPLYERPIL